MFWWNKHEYSDVRVLKKAADIVLGFTNIASQISLGLCSKDVPPSVLSNALVEMSNGLLEIELWQLLVKGPWALGCSVWASRGCSKDVPWLDKSYLTHYWTNQTEFWSSNYNKFFVFGLKSQTMLKRRLAKSGIYTLIEMPNGLLEIESWRVLVKDTWVHGCSVWASGLCAVETYF